MVYLATYGGEVHNTGICSRPYRLYLLSGPRLAEIIFYSYFYLIIEFYIPRLSNDMKIAVKTNHLVGPILYRSLVPSKKWRLYGRPFPDPGTLRIVILLECGLKLHR